MEFQKLVEEILQEDVVAGGVNSAFGANVGATATSRSGDTYAPNDSRSVTSLYGGMVTRRGMKSAKRSKKTKKRN